MLPMRARGMDLILHHRARMSQAVGLKKKTKTKNNKQCPFRTGKLLSFFVKNSKFQPTISLKYRKSKLSASPARALPAGHNHSFN